MKPGDCVTWCEGLNEKQGKILYLSMNGKTAYIQTNTTTQRRNITTIPTKRLTVQNQN